MTITLERAEDLFRSPIIAGRVADEIQTQADETREDLDELTALVKELTTRVALGMLDADARTEIAEAMLEITGRVADFAIAVAA